MNLLFDLYGVLLKTQSPSALKALEDATGSGPELWPVYWDLRPDFDAGRVTAEEYWEQVKQRLQLEAFDVQQAIEADYAGWLEPDPEMVDLVTSLGEQHRVGLLSNIPEGLAERVKERHTWLRDFHSVAMSCDIKVEKPDPEAYRKALELLGTKPEETHFFDDNEANVAAAEEFGLIAHHFTGVETLKAVL
ncbi:HAD family phosphatase [Corynebacterium sp. H128]|uniref:HAD family hydrolase n=1 Tax=Corynebacterium sp. H128 TaxID=3133427 RepID=UPI0030A4C707